MNLSAGGLWTRGIAGLSPLDRELQLTVQLVNRGGFSRPLSFPESPFVPRVHTSFPSWPGSGAVLAVCIRTLRPIRDQNDALSQPHCAGLSGLLQAGKQCASALAAPLTLPPAGRVRGGLSLAHGPAVGARAAVPSQPPARYGAVSSFPPPYDAEPPPGAPLPWLGDIVFIVRTVDSRFALLFLGFRFLMLLAACACGFWYCRQLPPGDWRALPWEQLAIAVLLAALICYDSTSPARRWACGLLRA